MAEANGVPSASGEVPRRRPVLLFVALGYLALCIAMLVGALLTSGWWFWLLTAGWALLAAYWLRRWANQD